MRRAGGQRHRPDQGAVLVGGDMRFVAVGDGPVVLDRPAGIGIGHIPMSAPGLLASAVGFWSTPQG